MPPTILKLPLCKEFSIQHSRLDTPSYSIHLPSIAPESIALITQADPVGNKPLPYPPEHLIPPAFYENAFKALPKTRKVDSMSQLLRPMLEGNVASNQQASTQQELSSLLQPASNRLFLTPESVSSVMGQVSQERLARPQRYGSDSSKHGVATPELNAIVHSQQATLLLAIKPSDWKDYTLLLENNTPRPYEDDLEALSNGGRYVILLLPLSTHVVGRSSYQSLHLGSILPPALLPPTPFTLTPLSLPYSLSFWFDWSKFLATGGIASPFHTSKGVTQLRLRLSSQLLNYKGHDYRSLSRQSQVLTKELYRLVHYRIEERVGRDGTLQKAVKSLHKQAPYYFKESILQICCLHKALICSDFYAIEHTSQNRERSLLRKQIRRATNS